MKSSQKYHGLHELFCRAAEHSAVVGRWSRTAILERAAVRYAVRASRSVAWARYVERLTRGSR